MKNVFGRVLEQSKKVYRLLRYPQVRTRFISEFAIRQQQDKRLAQFYPSTSKRLIIFLVPGLDWVSGHEKISGGTISIVSLCEETALIKDVHQAETILCTMSGEQLLEKHHLFYNTSWVYRFEQLSSYFQSVQSILIHIPEYLSIRFIETLGSDQSWLTSVRNVQINILNQNIRFMPDPAIVSQLKHLAKEVTVTTAHQKYCTPHFRELYGVPLHKLSVWISPEQYRFVEWQEKENLMVVSPDGHPMKSAILEQLKQVDGLSVQVIQNLTYEQYKGLISCAKWTLTFGEGLDGYFIEPIFSGAIGFGVYNEEFFTPDFKTLPGLYESMEALKNEIILDIQRFGVESIYKMTQRQQFDLCAVHYSKKTYQQNIILFYRKEYTYA